MRISPKRRNYLETIDLEQKSLDAVMLMRAKRDSFDLALKSNNGQQHFRAAAPILKS